VGSSAALSDYGLNKVRFPSALRAPHVPSELGTEGTGVQVSRERFGYGRWSRPSSSLHRFSGSANRLQETHALRGAISSSNYPQSGTQRVGRARDHAECGNCGGTGNVRSAVTTPTFQFRVAQRLVNFFWYQPQRRLQILERAGRRFVRARQLTRDRQSCNYSLVWWSTFAVPRPVGQ